MEATYDKHSASGVLLTLSEESQALRAFCFYIYIFSCLERQRRRIAPVAMAQLKDPAWGKPNG